MTTLLILTPHARDYAREVAARELPELEVLCATDDAEGRALIGEAEIVLGEPALVAGLAGQAGRLKWVQSIFAGVEPLCRPGLTDGFVLTGIKGVFGPLMSQYVFGYILALERHFFSFRDNQRRRRWEKIPYRRVADLTLGVVGLGDIGRHLVETARHFGMRVTGCSRGGDPVAGVDEVVASARIADFAAGPDYVVAALPETAETRALIDGAVFRRMTPSAVFMNVGRGSAVVEEDLIEALRGGGIGGAVLDVFADEPLPPESPLWGMDNVWITPHVSGTSLPADIVGVFCDNYRRYHQGRPLKYRVDPRKGY